MNLNRNNFILENFPKALTPYQTQVDALRQIEEAFKEGHKFVILNAPTGSGKSIIGATLAYSTEYPSKTFENLVDSYEIYKESSYESVMKLPKFGAFILTITKSLQNQYVTQFKDSCETLKGKRNYQCFVDEDFNCDIAPCIISSNQLKECWKNNQCYYYKHRNASLKNRFSVLNYSKYLNLQEHLRQRELLVCDECSELESELVNKFSCKVNYKKLKLCGISISKYKENEKNPLGWLQDAFQDIEHEYNKLKQQFSNASNTAFSKNDAAKMRYLMETYHSLELVCSTWAKVEYVIETNDEEVIFIPLRVNHLSHYLFDSCDRCVLMSATIINHKKFAESLGISKYKYIEVPSTFDAKKSPIFCNTKHPLNFKNLKDNLPKVLQDLKKIVEYHKEQKGMIHTHSFNITNEVKKVLRGKRYLYREDGSTNEQIVDEHFLRNDSTVLVSPSLTMGLDLHGNFGEWQVIMKLPYPSLESKRIKKLFEIDPEWYQMQMLKTLVQACGRCTRNKEDKSITYILDGNIKNTLSNHLNILPKYFVDRIV